MEVEKAIFVPLVFTSTGGMSPECKRANKQTDQLLAIKSKQAYAHVMCFIRKRLRFALLKATLIALRGYRGSTKSHHNHNILHPYQKKSLT